MIRSLSFALALMWPVTKLEAQTPTGDKEQPTLFFEVVYWGTWMDRPLKFKSDGQLKAIPLQAGGSSRYLYTGPSPLVFYRDEVMDAQTKELKPVPILSLPFKATCHHAVLLVSPVKEDMHKAAGAKDDDLTAQLIPLTPDTFPPNSVYLANLSGRTLKCKLADKTWEMKANEKGLYPVSGKDAKIYLIAAAEWKGSWQVMYTNSFRAGEGERRVIYFHTPAGSNAVAAMAAVIPPDAVCLDAKGRPIESPAVDPHGKASPRPTGIEGGWSGGPR